jgi:hypothetical protein
MAYAWAGPASEADEGFMPSMMSGAGDAARMSWPDFFSSLGEG